MQRLINDVIEHQRRIEDGDPERVDVLCVSLHYAAKLVMEQIEALSVYQGFDEAHGLDTWKHNAFHSRSRGSAPDHSEYGFAAAP